MNRRTIALLLLISTVIPVNAAAFTLTTSGAFYGPGKKGVFPFGEGQLRNVIITAPLKGYVPFFNNGPEPPNVRAEAIQGKEVNGRLSDGTLINENVDGAFVLKIKDDRTGESANMLIASVNGGPHEGVEVIEPDDKHNLTITLDVAFDPGRPELMLKTTVQFTTGAVEIPVSLKTQQGIPGGEDQAGPYPSGQVFIGKIGDFDQDGFIDGELVLARNAPLELVVGRGDPVLQIRPFRSDIPIKPIDAALLTLNGIVQNFPDVLKKVAPRGDVVLTLRYLNDITARLDAGLLNMKRVLAAKDLDKDAAVRAEQARGLMEQARQGFANGAELLGKGNLAQSFEVVKQAFGLTGAALGLIMAAGGGA